MGAEGRRGGSTAIASVSVDGSKLISGTHSELRWAAHPLSGVQGVFSALSTNIRKITKLCRSIGDIPSLGTR